MKRLSYSGYQVSSGVTVRTCVCVCVHACVHAYMRACVRVCVCVHIYICVCMCVFVMRAWWFSAQNTNLVSILETPVA